MRPNFIDKVYKSYPEVKSNVKGVVMREILSWLLSNHEGDLLEIGAFEGGTTKLLLDFAEEYDRHVYVVDPWCGVQQGTEAAYSKFMESVGDHPRLTVHRQSSLDSDTKKLINDMNLCFAFADGLHTVEACRSDVLTCEQSLGSGLIIVDDIRNVYGTQPYAHKLFEMVKGLEHDTGWEHYPSPENWQYTLIYKK